jgi:hypothetical protein
MDQIKFDISSKTNQDAADDLDQRKADGWTVTDAGRDPANKNILLVTLKEPQV